MTTDLYPVPAVTFYDPTFLPITTASSQLLRVNKYSHLYVTYMPGEPAATTNLGQVSYDDTAFATLCTITATPNQTVLVYGLHVAGDLQGEVNLTLVELPSTETIELVGLITESNPNWNPPFGGIPIELTSTSSFEVRLEIKALRNRLGVGSGRIFARVL
jgi:hypothetical protein